MAHVHLSRGFLSISMQKASLLKDPRSYNVRRGEINVHV